MKFVAFTDPEGSPVYVNIELIRVIDGDTDNDGPLTDMAFDGSHTVSVRGEVSDTLAAIEAALRDK